MEPLRLPGVCHGMTIKHPKANDPPVTLSTVKARGGVTGNKVRYVLAASLVLAVLGLAIVYAGVPGGLMDGPTSAPGPR
jgi:hypothetical protein